MSISPIRPQPKPPARGSSRRLPGDLDAEIEATAVKLTSECGEVIPPGRVLVLAARRGLATITADDVRKRPRGNTAA